MTALRNWATGSTMIATTGWIAGVSYGAIVSSARRRSANSAMSVNNTIAG